MNSMRPPSAAIFFMTYFHMAWGGGHGLLGPLGSATAFPKWSEAVKVARKDFRCHNQNIP